MRLIDADALKECAVQADDVLYDSYMAVSVDDIDDAPTIDPVKHGHWKSCAIKGIFGMSDKYIHKCSVCGNTLDFHGVNAGRGDANFCPNCGARMDGAAE